MYGAACLLCGAATSDSMFLVLFVCLVVCPSTVFFAHFHGAHFNYHKLISIKDLPSESPLSLINDHHTHMVMAYLPWFPAISR